MGLVSPFKRFTLASLLIPTISLSPCLCANLSNSRCPLCSTSNTPLVQTVVFLRKSFFRMLLRKTTIYVFFFNVKTFLRKFVFWAKNVYVKKFLRK